MPSLVNGKNQEKVGQTMPVLIIFFHVHTFYAVTDSIATKVDRHFNEVSSELLQNFSCLDPRDSFSRFNVKNLENHIDLSRVFFLVST